MRQRSPPQQGAVQDTVSHGSLRYCMVHELELAQKVVRRKHSHGPAVSQVRRSTALSFVLCLFVVSSPSLRGGDGGWPARRMRQVGQGSSLRLVRGGAHSEVVGLLGGLSPPSRLWREPGGGGLWVTFTSSAAHRRPRAGSRLRGLGPWLPSVVPPGLVHLLSLQVVLAK